MHGGTAPNTPLMHYLLIPSKVPHRRCHCPVHSSVATSYNCAAQGCGEYIENKDTNAQASQLPLEPGPKKKKTTKGIKRSKVAA